MFTSINEYRNFVNEVINARVITNSPQNLVYVSQDQYTETELTAIVKDKLKKYSNLYGVYQLGFRITINTENQYVISFYYREPMDVDDERTDASIAKIVAELQQEITN